MQRTPDDSLDPGTASSSNAASKSNSHEGTANSLASTSPRFPITRLEATDRAEWQSRAIERSFANNRSDHKPADLQSSTGHDSPASSKPSTPTTPVPTSRTYHSFNYASRQRNSLRPSAASVFQSHSSQFSQAQQGAAASSGRVSPAQLSPNALPPAASGVSSYASPRTATTHLSTSPSYPTISLPDDDSHGGAPRPRASNASEANTARTAMARMQLQQMQDEARQLGLNEKSAGWLILEALQAASEGEWAAVANLLANGDATLLLPRDPPSVFTSASQLSASFAYDHTIFNASSVSAAKPTPSALPSGAAGLNDALPVVMLSGLRGILSRASSSDGGTYPNKCQLILQSFVVKTSQGSVSSLKDIVSRQETLEALAPLPDAISPDSPRYRYPTFSLSASNAQFPLPPPLNARTQSNEDQAGSRRTRSNSKLNAAQNRASASFASLFGGSGRDRRRQAAAETAGSEMVDAQKLSVNAAYRDERASQSGGASQETSDTETGAEQASSLGLDIGDSTKNDSGQGVADNNESSSNTSASRRTVSVWVVDHLVRRSAVMRTISKTLDARIKTRLAAFNIDDSVSEVVASFAATYLPPIPSLGDTASSKPGNPAKPSSSSAIERSRASSPVSINNPPYLADPDDMSENFQDFFNSIRDQLYKIDTSTSQPGTQDSAETSGSSSLASQRDQHERIEQQLEAVESVLCEEVYDRIFCPVTSSDGYHDDALASRIAALNVLGLSLRHLGLDVPAERVDGDSEQAQQSNAMLDGLDRIVKGCGAELQRLESALCRSPKAKLDVLVKAHKVAVDGVAELPSIKMRDEDSQDAKESTLSTGKKGGDTTSADLILPILIYSIVSSNPSRLASNLVYIQRFRAESLVQGETSYCLVNVQAAVAFLENVDVKDLGLDSSQIGVHLKPNTADSELTPRRPSAASRSSSLEAPGVGSEHSPAALAMPARIRGRLTQEIGDLAGASNKVITGVMGSSISAFSRMMGAAANTPFPGGGDEGAEGTPSRPLAMRRRTKSSASTHSATNLQPPSHPAHPPGPASRSLRSRASNSTIATDYSHTDEQSKEKDVANPPTADSSSGGKPSLGDRLASLSMLGRLGSSNLSSSPSSSSLGVGYPPGDASPRAVSRELPGPPPPSKLSSTTRPASYLAAQLNRISLPRTISSSSVTAAEEKPLPASLQSPYAPLSTPPTAERPLHVVLASTGSVASVKIPLIVEALLTYANVRVQVIATDNSLHFYDRNAIAKLNAQCGGQAEGEEGGYSVATLAAENLAASRRTLAPSHLSRAHLWTDADEWTSFSRIGDPILHIELRRWADIVVVAPCSANTLAKLSAGICDDLLTSFMRALSSETRTVLYPAMNTLMWLHPLTNRHLEVIREVLGYEVKGPVEKKLACGDLGQGAMVEWTEILGDVVARFGLVKAEVGKKGEE